MECSCLGVFLKNVLTFVTVQSEIAKVKSVSNGSLSSDVILKNRFLGKMGALGRSDEFKPRTIVNEVVKEQKEKGH